MAGRLTDEERADRAMSEKNLHSRVAYRARKYGVKMLHIQRALAAGQWMTPAAKGFPDLLIVTRFRIMFRELKKELGKLTPEQEEWRDRLIQSGGDYDVWRPSDLRSGRIERELKD